MSDPAPGGQTIMVQTDAPPRKVPWHRRVPSARRLIVFSLIVFPLAVATLVAGFLYIRMIPELEKTGGAWKTFQTWVEEPGKLAFEGKERMNILVVGVDYNHDERGMPYTKGARTDTIMVLSLDPKAQMLNVLSIPRDLRVLISEEHGYEKINSAYSFGGIDQTRETVSQFLGVPIHHFVIVKVYGVPKMVDALGGVPIDVEKDMDYDDNWGKLHIHLKKGHQVLDGPEVIGYSRFRHDEEGDRGRIRRQQQVIRALVDRLKDPAIVLKLNQIAKVVKENIETDLAIAQMLDLAMLYKDFDRSKMRSGKVDGDDCVDGNGISYIEPYGPENERMIMSLLKMPPNLNVSDLQVEVLNGSGTQGAGRDLVESLRAQGFQIVRVARADRSDVEITQVILYGQGRLRTHLATVIPGADILIENPRPKEMGPQITILLGKDMAPPPPVALPQNDYPTYVPDPQPDFEPEPAPEPEPEPEPVMPEPVDTGASEPVEVTPPPEPVPEEIPLEPAPEPAPVEPAPQPEPAPEPAPEGPPG